MARQGGGVEFKALGASLNDLARTMRELPKNTPAALAYASSGVLQQSGKVFLARYITPEDWAKNGGRKTSDYTEPTGATHGPVRMRGKDANGVSIRNARGQFVTVASERKLFIKGKLVSRSGAMRLFAQELAASNPTESVNVEIAQNANPKQGDRGEIMAGITPDGSGYLEITGGWKAAESGTRGGYPAGTKGWWRALRTVQNRFATLLRKKYPGLMIPKAAGR